MTKPLKASDAGLKPHWKVRIYLNAGAIHTASWKRPELSLLWNSPDRVLGDRLVKADWIQDSEYGDVIGSVDWDHVVAISWRWSSLCLMIPEQMLRKCIMM